MTTLINRSSMAWADPATRITNWSLLLIQLRAVLGSDRWNTVLFVFNFPSLYVENCVCVCGESTCTFRLGMNTESLRYPSVIITKLHPSFKYKTPCNSFRAVWPGSRTVEIIIFHSDPIGLAADYGVVVRFNEIEGLLISVKVLLIISDDGNKIDGCLKVHVRVFT